MRRGVSVAGVVAIGFAGMTGLSWFMHSNGSVAIDERITSVELDVSSGHVEIVGSPSGETSLEFEVKSGWSRDGNVEHEVDGDTLRIHGGCDTGIFPGLWCKSDVTVTVPADADIVAETSAGAVTVSGLSGSTELVAHSGDLTIKDQRGRLTAHASAGAVTVDGLDADVAKVTSSAGPVDVEAVQTPNSLDAESSAGDVTVRVPGDESYDVEADASVGDASVDVPTAHGSAHKIRAFSSAGSVTISGR